MSNEQAKPAAAAADSAKVFAEVAQRSSRIMADFLKRQAGSKNSVMADEFGIAKAFMDLSALMFAKPQYLAEAQMKMFWDYTRLWQSGWMQMMGQEVEPVATPKKGDNRFRHEDWENHFLFDYVKQFYLIAARAPGEGKLRVIEDAPGSYASLRLGAEKAAQKTGSTK